MFLFPLIVFVSWLPGAVDRAYTTFTGNTSFILIMIHVIFSRSQGFLNVVFYAKSKIVDIKKKLFRSEDLGDNSPTGLGTKINNEMTDLSTNQKKKKKKNG